MKKIICTVLVAFSFCLINSGDASARRVERDRLDFGDGKSYLETKTVYKNNGTVKTVFKEVIDGKTIRKVKNVDTSNKK